MTSYTQHQPQGLRDVFVHLLFVSAGFEPTPKSYLLGTKDWMKGKQNLARKVVNSVLKFVSFQCTKEASKICPHRKVRQKRQEYMDRLHPQTTIAQGTDCLLDTGWPWAGDSVRTFLFAQPQKPEAHSLKAGKFSWGGSWRQNVLGMDTWWFCVLNTGQAVSRMLTCLEVFLIPKYHLL